MTGRIAVLCPTRDRPAQFLSLVDSVTKTTNRADVVAYIDKDQQQLYQASCDGADAVLRSRMSMHVGERLGPTRSANELVKQFEGYDVYGMIPDDAVVTTPGWGEWCLEAVKFFPNSVGVISPHHNQGGHVDMPFVTKEWIAATGWYALPIAYHFAWPLVTGLIGEMTAIFHASEQRFSISHDLEMTKNQAWRSADTEFFLPFVARELMPIVERVRNAMRSEE